MRSVPAGRGTAARAEQSTSWSGARTSHRSPSGPSTSTSLNPLTKPAVEDGLGTDDDRRGRNVVAVARPLADGDSRQGLQFLAHAGHTSPQSLQALGATAGAHHGTGVRAPPAPQPLIVLFDGGVTALA